MTTPPASASGDHHASAHPHRPSRGRSKRRLALTLALVAGYMAAEAVGGWLANSLALLADAGHMLADAGALALSLFALWVAQRPPTPRRTYGYYRAEILAALVNGAALLAIAASLLVEAVGRLGEPPEVRGGLMVAVAAGGLAVNLTGLWLLHAERSASLNVRGAWLHLLSDTLGSAAAITAGLALGRPRRLGAHHAAHHSLRLGAGPRGGRGPHGRSAGAHRCG